MRYTTTHVKQVVNLPSSLRPLATARYQIPISQQRGVGVEYCTIYVLCHHRSLPCSYVVIVPTHINSTTRETLFELCETKLGLNIYYYINIIILDICIKLKIYNASYAWQTVARQIIETYALTWSLPLYGFLKWLNCLTGIFSFQMLALFDAEFSILFILKQPTQQTANPRYVSGRMVVVCFVQKHGQQHGANTIISINREFALTLISSFHI